MINKNLLPQVVVDAVDKMLNDHNVNIRHTYQQRVEMIKMFCEQALLEYSRKKK
jgi:hypothetical protein